MITHDDLIAAGFRRYAASSNLDKGPLYQKRYENSEGRPLFFLNLTEYDFSDRMAPEMADNYRWAASAHLYFGEHEFADVAYCIRSSTSLADVEAFYNRAFHALGCICDPHND